MRAYQFKTFYFVGPPVSNADILLNKEGVEGWMVVASWPNSLPNGGVYLLLQRPVVVLESDLSKVVIPLSPGEEEEMDLPAVDLYWKGGTHHNIGLGVGVTQSMMAAVAKKSGKVCKYCGKDGMVWKNLAMGQWKLWDLVGDVAHTCQK